MRPRAILGATVAVLVGCSGQSAPSATSFAAPSPTPTAAPSAIASPTATVIAADRPATVHVPGSYDPSRPAPLLIVLHGFTSSGAEHESYFHLQAEAERRGFLTVYPDGTKDTDGNRFWSATDACCDFDRTGVNDVAYLDGLITAIQGQFAIDPKRVDMVGHSNGGFMAYRMACVHADRIAAIVSLAGATFANPADCAPSGPVAVLQIHGTADDVVAFAGGTLQGLPAGKQMAAFPGAETTAATWARYDGCAADPQDVPQPVDVDADLNGPAGPAEATVKRWTACKPGGSVELWTIPGGGHAPTLSTTFPTAVLDFLGAHPKP